MTKIAEPKVKITPEVVIPATVEFSNKAKERLLRLAKLLRADARRKGGIKFDINIFCATKDIETKPSTSCGTRACALGLAALSDEFKREGLGYKVDPYFSYESGKIINGIVFLYKGKGFGGNEMRVASLVFDIPEDVASWLFSGEAPTRTNGEGAKAEIEMAEIIEKAAKGDIPEHIIESLVEFA